MVAAAGLKKGKNVRSLSPPSGAPRRIGAVANVGSVDLCPSVVSLGEPINIRDPHTTPPHRNDTVQRLADIGLGLDDSRKRWRSFERFPAVLVCFESELGGKASSV